MTEIFSDISETVKDIAKTAWSIARAQKNPLDAAEFLNNVTNYYSNILTEEEVDFLRFYFQLQMEMVMQ